MENHFGETYDTSYPSTEDMMDIVADDLTGLTTSSDEEQLNEPDVHQGMELVMEDYSAMFSDIDFQQLEAKMTNDSQQLSYYVPDECYPMPDLMTTSTEEDEFAMQFAQQHLPTAEEYTGGDLSHLVLNPDILHQEAVPRDFLPSTTLPPRRGPPTAAGADDPRIPDLGLIRQNYVLMVHELLDKIDAMPVTAPEREIMISEAEFLQGRITQLGANNACLQQRYLESGISLGLPTAAAAAAPVVGGGEGGSGWTPRRLIPPLPSSQCRWTVLNRRRPRTRLGPGHYLCVVSLEWFRLSGLGQYDT
ncbi:uncharacterized protein PG986_004859 [Apiospora aurea]|uniref:Uncharacterized protein n=1 Tax=Apiospora aurea TaxID=335848 RepID=A0ABR1QFX5_9PEZI